MTKVECYSLGYISKTVGSKGELLLVLDVDDIKRYRRLESVFVELSGQLVPFFITAIELRGNGAKVSFDGIETTARAEELTRKSLYLPLSFLPPLKGKRFYYHEVTGFTAVDKTYGAIGHIESILDYPTQALFQIRKGTTEILIPVKEEFIITVDRINRRVELDAPEGLIDVYLGPQESSDDGDDEEQAAGSEA